MGSHQSLLPAEAARLLYEIVEEHDQASTEKTRQFLAQIESIRKDMNAAFEPLGQSEAGIVRMLREAHLLNTNAKIEAARAGRAGAAFSAVVERIAELSNNIDDSLELISSASTQLKEGIANLAATQERIESELGVNQEELQAT